MDKEKLSVALMKTMAETMLSGGPDQMQSRFETVHDLDMHMIFEFIDQIIIDSLEFAISSKSIREQIEEYEGEAQQLMATKIVMNLSAQRAFFAGYFLAEERFSNESIRS